VRQPLCLGEILRLGAGPTRHGAKPALVWGERTYTYAELNARANQAAHALHALGVQRGERVAVLGRNCPEYVWLYFALAKLGAILVPVNFWYRSGEIAYTLRQSGTTTFLFDERFRPQAETAAREVPGVRRSLTWGGRPSVLETHMAEMPEVEPEATVTPDDHHIILYTSGTTGFPKGALFRHQAHYLHAVSWALMTGQREGDVGLLVYPLFHTGGPDCVLLPHLLVGGTVVLLDGAEPQAMLQAISRHRVNNVFAVPTVWRRLLGALEGAPAQAYDVSSVRRCLGSSDTLPPDLLEAILARFEAEVYVTYGLTEAGCILTYSRLSRDSKGKIRAVGRAHPLVELRLGPPQEGTDGAQDGPPAGVAPGAVGEVLARGPTLMDGYWDMPDKTAETMAGGWLHSGDLGRFDADGDLYLAGRAKDVIISGGEKVYPLEVEQLLKELPGVAEAALVGVPDTEWGEAVLACVVRTDDEAGRALTAEAIQRFVRPRLAGYKCPRFVEFLSALPKTAATNKVQKAVLRQRYATLGEKSPVPLPEAPAGGRRRG
jgi:fatty-acyl-CoA synthase